MVVKIDKRFEKDTDKIKDKKLLNKVARCIGQAIEAESLEQVSNLKKLQGFTDHYRIRIGDYRAGLRLEEGTLIFERFLSRKDIYKYFPK